MLQARGQRTPGALLVLFLCLAVGACAAPGGRGGAGGSDILSGASPGSAENCLEDELDDSPYLEGFASAFCGYVVLGFVDAVAYIGQSQPNTFFCVGRDFDFESYRSDFLQAIAEDSDLDDAAGEQILLRLTSLGEGGRDCGWQGPRSLREQSDDCQWVLQLGDEDGMEELARRSGVRSVGALVDLALEAMARCMGYSFGYLIASATAGEVESGLPFCIDQDDVEFPEDETGDARFIAIADVSVKALQRQPARADEWAAKHLFEFEVENYPCTSAASAPERSIPERRASWKKARDLTEIVSMACRNDPKFESSYQFFTARGYCDMFLSGLVEGYAAVQGAKSGSAACLRGGVTPAAVKSSLKESLSAGGQGINLARLLRSEFEGASSACRWVGRESAPGAAESCLQLVGDKTVDRAAATEKGARIYEWFRIEGRELDRETRRSFSSCMGYMQGLVFAAAQVPTSGAAPAVCLPERKDWEATALHISLDVQEQAEGTVGTRAGVASIAYQSATRWAACGPTAVN